MELSDSHEQDWYETDSEQEPKPGDHGTCGWWSGAREDKSCGAEIVLREGRSQFDGGLIVELRWHHDGSEGFILDHHHKAELGGPA